MDAGEELKGVEDGTKVIDAGERFKEEDADSHDEISGEDLDVSADPFEEDAGEFLDDVDADEDPGDFLFDESAGGAGAAANSIEFDDSRQSNRSTSGTDEERARTLRTGKGSS